jgi:hypothetical protein
MASTELQAIVRFRFHDGDVEEFKRLSAQCMEIVRTQDTGTLQYDTYFNDDETESIVIERFRDRRHGIGVGRATRRTQHGAPGKVHRRRPGAALHALGEAVGRLSDSIDRHV